MSEIRTSSDIERKIDAAHMVCDELLRHGVSAVADMYCVALPGLIESIDAAVDSLPFAVERNRINESSHVEYRRVG
jgi:hypothetical protein